MAEEVRVVSKEQAEHIGTGLPPAGYERNEELKIRQDTLEEAGEKRAGKLEVEAIDPKKLKVDREIRGILENDPNALMVSDNDAMYEYCWVYFGRQGTWVWRKKHEGWEVVSGKMVESKEYLAEDTTRRIGDVLLMRMRKDRFAILEAKQLERKKKQDLGVVGHLRELGEKYAGTGIKVHTSADSRLQSGRGVMETVEARAATQVAGSGVDKMVREGSVPGLPNV